MGFRINTNKVRRDRTAGVVNVTNTDTSAGDITSDDLALGIPEKANEPIDINAPSSAKGVKSASSTSSNFSKAQAGLGVAQSVAGIADAVLEFEQIDSTAKLNMMFANIQFNESLRLGREQALQAETQGFARGEQGVLSAVAQGQSAQGGIAQSSQLAEETLGVLNAIAIENNAIREAYGFKSEIALIEHERNLAEINRNAKIATSALSGAISALSFV